MDIEAQQTSPNFQLPMEGIGFSQSEEEVYAALCLLSLAGHDQSPVFSQSRPLTLRHKCSLCGKAFASSQALGGHMSIHRKPIRDNRIFSGLLASSPSDGPKGHQCLICWKTFATGPALGGHKRCHFDGTIGSAVGKGSAARATMADSKRSLDFWRKFFGSAETDIFELIEKAIVLAAVDRPNEFKEKKDLIAEKLQNLNNGDNDPRKEEEEKKSSNCENPEPGDLIC